MDNLTLSFFVNACIIVIHALILQCNCKSIITDMKPINFPQSIKVLQRPSTMSESECSSLHVWSDGKQCVSCWRPTFAERLKILFTGKVWLGVMSGGTQPPVFLSGEQVFVNASISDRIKAFFAEVKESIKDVYKSVSDAFKQPDKCKHFVVGFTISLLVGIFMPFLGLLVGIIAGALKEWWDKNGHGTVELMDFAFTCFGALCALPFAWLIKIIL